MCYDEWYIVSFTMDCIVFIPETDNTIRLRLTVHGIVQGVGFRPFVYRLATELGLGGWVCNDANGVTVEVEGSGEAVRLFVVELPRQAPPLAAVDRIQTMLMESLDSDQFVIRRSAEGQGQVPIS